MRGSKLSHARPKGLAKRAVLAARPERLRAIATDLAVLAVAMAQAPKKDERKIVERWLAARR